MTTHADVHRPQPSRRYLVPLLLHVALPLAVGCAVYLVVRPAPALAEWTSQAVGLDGRPAFRVRGWARDQLPDAAWAYALTATPLVLWEDGPAAARRAWTAIAVVLAVGWELAQLPHLVPGSFSRGDLTASAAAALLAVGVLYVARRRREAARRPLHERPT